MVQREWNLTTFYILIPDYKRRLFSFLKPINQVTDNYVQHSMYRIKDPQVSFPFYTEALGMTLLHSATLALDDK